MSATVKEVAEMLRKPKGRVRNVAAKADRTYKGIVYDSKAEMLHAFRLDALKADGKIKGWTRQISFPLMVNETLICMFKVDFIVQEDDHDVIHEVKGWETPEYRIKYKLFKALYPDMPYKVVRA